MDEVSLIDGSEPILMENCWRTMAISACMAGRAGKNASRVLEEPHPAMGVNLHHWGSSSINGLSFMNRMSIKFEAIFGSYYTI